LESTYRYAIENKRANQTAAGFINSLSFDIQKQEQFRRLIRWKGEEVQASMGKTADRLADIKPAILPAVPNY